MDNVKEINEKLTEFAERIPGKGMHISYLSKASELMELYGNMLSIMQEENSKENQEKVEKILNEINQIINKGSH